MIMGFDVYDKDGSKLDIAIIELDTVFRHIDKVNGWKLLIELDRDRSSYNINVFDDSTALEDACRMLAGVSLIKDCQEFKKYCPFADGIGNSCDGECCRAEEWMKYFRNL